MYFFLLLSFFYSFRRPCSNYSGSVSLTVLFSLYYTVLRLVYLFTSSPLHLFSFPLFRLVVLLSCFLCRRLIMLFLLLALLSCKLSLFRCLSISPLLLFCSSSFLPVPFRHFSPAFGLTVSLSFAVTLNSCPLAFSRDVSSGRSLFTHSLSLFFLSLA